MNVFFFLLAITLATAISAPLSAAVIVGRGDCGSPVTLEPGERLEVLLPGNPTTGFLWLAALLPPVLRHEEGESFLSDSDLPGAGGRFTLRFTATKGGMGELLLQYRRPWEEKVPPLESCSFPITVKSRALRTTAIYISSGGKRMTACFDSETNRVAVTLPDGHTVSLPAALAASGTRYGDDRESFWEHHGTGRFSHGDTLLFEGKISGNGAKPEPLPPAPPAVPSSTSRFPGEYR